MSKPECKGKIGIVYLIIIEGNISYRINDIKILMVKACTQFNNWFVKFKALDAECTYINDIIVWYKIDRIRTRLIDTALCI